MCRKKYDLAVINHLVLWLVAADAFGQGFLVLDQASGTLDEFVQAYSQLPDNQLAQSFTPSISAVGFVQFSHFVPAFPGNGQVTFVVNLRAGAYNGPILSSTDPVILASGPIQIGTFYFPQSVPVTSGQLYFFEPVLQSTGFLNIGTKSPSGYVGGALWSNGGMDPNADLWFREGVVVPECSTGLFLLLGLALVLSYRGIRQYSRLSR